MFLLHHRAVPPRGLEPLQSGLKIRCPASRAQAAQAGLGRGQRKGREPDPQGSYRCSPVFGTGAVTSRLAFPERFLRALGGIRTLMLESHGSEPCASTVAPRARGVDDRVRTGDLGDGDAALSRTELHPPGMGGRDGDRRALSLPRHLKPGPSRRPESHLPGSNGSPAHYEWAALPAELRWRAARCCRTRIRT